MKINKITVDKDAIFSYISNVIERETNTTERENKMSMGQEFNFVITNENLEDNFPTDNLIETLFDGESFIPVTTGADMFDILVMAGLFRSKSEARKNWKRTGKDVPEGFTDIERIGKLKHRLTIWNPKEDK